jgi:putative cell wall-binding protein
LLATRHPSTSARRDIRTTVAAVLVTLLVLTALPARAQDSQRIGDEADPILTAIDLSRASFADGEASRVVLGRSDRFPDNLAGAAATNSQGPLLLVDAAPQPLAGDVVNEIERVLGPGQGSCDRRVEDVLVLGGTAAVDESVLDALTGLGYCPIRLAGDERVGTSVAVASYLLQQFLTPDTSRGPLMIATADNPADSAAASAWAAQFGVPIVVTSPTALDQQVADLLQPGDTSWDTVFLLGGTAALSDDVEQQVRDWVDPASTEVRRIAGATRDDTALQVALELWGNNDSRPTAIVEGFRPDFWTVALPGAVAAARFGTPMLYVQTDGLPDTTAGYLETFPQSFVLTIGSQERISEQTRADAEALAGVR